MIHLMVHIRFPDGNSVIVGDLAVAEPDPGRGGALEGEFRYRRAYLDDPRAFSIDPEHLPLEPGIFEARRPRAGVPAVFEDSLPDDWGRELLTRKHRLTRDEQRVPVFLKLVGLNGLGALGYEDAGPPRGRRTRRWTLAKIAAQTKAAAQAEAAVPDLPALAAAARRVLEGEDPARNDLDLLFRAGSSLGGARPKVLIYDDGIHWLAKLPVWRDTVNFVRIEAATLKLACAAGLEVPDCRVVQTGNTEALLVRRFEIADPATSGGRYHRISLATLLGAENFYNLGYADIAEVLRRVSDRPQTDLMGIFRQAVFNAMVGNTDDHLKNFSMLHDARGWRLSPGYDLLPDVMRREEHVLSFGLRGNRPDYAALIELGRQTGLSSARMMGTIEEVYRTVENWESVFRSYDVPEADMEFLRPTIKRRLLRCAPESIDHRPGTPSP